ncbi:MAG: hypothetical protein HGB05_16775, partial [Chloroflexi bacterium]|nr:hypothetical protein [Chloroflexota bacterium]
LEDVQGTYECLAFPRTWKQTQDLWQKDKIVLVRGTIDGKGKVAKILLDSATDKPQVTSAIPDKKGSGISDQISGNNGQPPINKLASANGAQKPNIIKEQGASFQVAPARPVNGPAAAGDQSPKINGQQPHRGASQPAATNQRPANSKQSTTRPAVEDHFEVRDEVFFGDDPFAGEVFIPDVDDPIAGVVPVEDFGIPQHDNPLAESTADYRGRTAEPIAAVVKQEFIASVPVLQVAEPASTSQAVQPGPAPKKNGNGQGHAGNGKDYGTLSEPYRMAKVVISRSGDSTLDASRVGEVHHLLSSYPGPDRFCFLIKARGETLQLDFPNDTTTLDEMMIDQLKSLHGVESVQVSMSL